MKTKTTTSSHWLLVPLFLFLWVFVMIEYTNLSLIFANSVRDMRWYLGGNEITRRYDESLLLAKQGRYSEAKSLLAPILNEKNLENPGDVFELYGDLVYSLSGSSGDILPFYHRALEQGENLRVEKKIALIEESASSSQEAGTGSTGKSPETSSGSTSSGELNREMTKQEIQSIQKNRAGLVNYHPDTEEETRGRIQDAFTVLGGGEEKRDW